MVGIKAVIAKHNQTGKMSVHFKADESGRVTPSHAEAVLEVTEEYTVKVPVAAKPDPVTAKPKPGANRPDRADNVLADDDEDEADEADAEDSGLAEVGLSGDQHVGSWAKRLSRVFFFLDHYLATSLHKLQTGL